MKKILFGSLGLVAVLTASMFFASCKGGADTAIESGGGGGGNRPVQPGKGNETVTDIVVTFDNGWTEAEVTDGADDPYTIFNKIKSVVTPNQNNKTLNAVQNTQLLNEYNAALSTYNSDKAAYDAEWAAYEAAVAEEPSTPAPTTAEPVKPVAPPKVLPYFPGESILLESGFEETEGSIPEWDFHVFKGWFDESGTEEITASTVFDANTTIYAKWETGFAKPYYTINFDPQNGDSVVRRLAVPTTFTYYADTSDGTDDDDFEEIALDPSNPDDKTWVTSTIAKAEMIEGQARVAVYADYKITGNQTNSSGGTGITLNYGSIIPAFTREHYTNDVSWKIGDTPTSITETKTYTGDTTIYRQWTPKKYTVTFNLNAPSSTSPSAISPITNIDGPTASSGGLTADSKTLPANPANVTTSTDVEYQFIGWNTLDDGTGGTWTALTNITDSITVFGKWQIAGVPAKTFAYSGAIQTWTVPENGVYEIELNGAEGGQYNADLGGKGGYIKGDVYLAQGTVLNVSVGGRGVNGKAATSAGGYNGGGAGGDSANHRGLNYSGAGGGGATDVRIGGTALTNRIIVAGGGGGNGWGRAGGSGGKGNGGVGENGLDGNSYAGIMAGTGGGGGTLIAGGTASITGKTNIGGYTPGALGQGGIGGNGNKRNSGNAGSMADGAGGGGGGYYGGGGAFTYNDNASTDDTSSYSSGGGGGGGSSWASVAGGTAPNASYPFQNVTAAAENTYGSNTGNGSAKITWKQPSW